jgi:hypothetical protein
MEEMWLQLLHGTCGVLINNFTQETTSSHKKCQLPPNYCVWAVKMEIDKHMKLISRAFDVSIMPSSPSCFFKDGTRGSSWSICFIHKFVMYSTGLQENLYIVSIVPHHVFHTHLQTGCCQVARKRDKFGCYSIKLKLLFEIYFLAATVQMDYDWPSTGLNNSPTLSNKYKTCTWIRSVVQHLIVLKLNYLFLARVRVSPWECTACPASCLFMVVVTVPEDTQLW